MSIATVTARRGRPPQSGVGGIYGWGPGVHLAWADGTWQGTPRLVIEALDLCLNRDLVFVPGIPGAVVVRADDRDPVCVLAVIGAVIGPDARFGGAVPGEVLADLTDTMWGLDAA